MNKTTVLSQDVMNKLLEQAFKQESMFVISPDAAMSLQGTYTVPFDPPVTQSEPKSVFTLADMKVFVTPYLPPDEKMLPRKWKKRIGGQAWRKPIVCRQEVPSESVYMISAPPLPLFLRPQPPLRLSDFR